MRDAPPAHALPVEVELGRELVEAAADARPGVRIGSQLPAAVAQERGRVELALADDRLRVDREPGLAGGPQDVAAVEVLVGDDQFALRGPGLAEEPDRLVEQSARSYGRPFRSHV